MKNEEIKSFAKENYRVKFPMFSKINVNTRNAHPIFDYLRGNSSLNGARIYWNFGKFLVSKTGDIIGYYGPGSRPFDMKSIIEENL